MASAPPLAPQHPTHRRKVPDGQKNGFPSDRRMGCDVRKSSQGKASDDFLQAFEKPTQIYRYMQSMSQGKAPMLLHRNLSYMKERMSRTHHRRAGYRVETILDRVMGEIDMKSTKGRRDLTLVFKSFEDPQFTSGDAAFAVISASIISIHQHANSSRRSFCGRRCDEPEERVVLMSMEKDVPVANGGNSPASVRMTINKDVFPKMSSSFVKCVLVITARPKYQSQGPNRGTIPQPQVSPDSKRRKKVESMHSPGTVFKSEIVIFNSRMDCSLVSGRYQVLSKPDETSTHNQAVWIGTDADSSRKGLSKGEAKVYLEVQWSEPPKPLASIKSMNGFISHDKQLPLAICPAPDEEEVNISFQFQLKNEYQETIMQQRNFECPWCNLNCLCLKPFACHLKYMHPRFHFRIRYERKGLRTDVQVEVSVNDSFDGSYSGNPQDLFLAYSAGVASGGPMRRTPFTIVLVHKRKDMLNDPTIDPDEDDIEPLRPTIHGHDRLYYHTNTCIPIRPQDMDIDSEDENDPQWMRYKTQQMIDDFTDVNDGEKEVMKLWNLHIMKYGFTGDCQIPEACRIFLEERGDVLREKNLRLNFILHLISLYDYGLIDAVQKANLIRKLNSIFMRPCTNGHSVLTPNNNSNEGKTCQVS